MSSRQRTSFFLRPAALSVCFCILAAACGLAATESPDCNELLRQAVANEKRNGDSGYYAWMDRLQKPRGVVTKLMVSTPQGIIARTLAYNDKPLSADERRQDDERINRLLDPEKMREKARKQQEDQQRLERILVALPDAFRCRYGDSSDARELRLECTPNPGFSPPNYETQVLQGMSAVILIDRDDRRITRIEGTLFKEVTFGWGFLGKLERGGFILITQSKVTAKHWDITQMKLVFNGRLLMVKPLHIEENDSSWEYRAVPSMSVKEALDYLRKAKS
jgi:hypothetical protein